MAFDKSIMEDVFDGPNSIFGSIFGPSTYALRKKASAAKQAASYQPAKKPAIKLTLSATVLDDICAGRMVRFMAKGQELLLVREQ